MILIVSIEFDQSTYDVANWIKFLTNEEVIILNENNHVAKFGVTISPDGKSDISLKTSCGHKIELNFIRAIWLRKGSFYFGDQILESKVFEINSIIKSDISALTNYIYYTINPKIVIGQLNSTEINKFIVLKEAVNVGLIIPSTLITNNKECIYNYFKDGNLITKSINSIHFQTKRLSIVSHTKRIYYSLIPEHFKVSLLQKEILKKYELRIFFLNNIFFTSAIFSQTNEKTKLDFRDYDIKMPNRIVPYVLPKDIMEKLIILMRRLGLKTGSIDMIVTPSNEYIFLEVNPEGQFGMISKTCNFFLEREIAKALINMKNERAE